MLKIRRPLGRLIFNMGIAIPGKTVFLIETAPWSPPTLIAIWALTAETDINVLIPIIPWTPHTRLFTLWWPALNIPDFCYILINPLTFINTLTSLSIWVNEYVTYESLSNWPCAPDQTRLFHLLHSKSIDLPIPKMWLLKIWSWKSKVEVMGEVKV